MNWCNDYVGLPYRAGGRTREGVDCWGLVRLVYADRHGITLPAFETIDATDTHGVQQAITEITARAAEGWARTDAPRPGDVVLLRLAGQLSHMGLVLGGGQFLHAREGSGVAVERLTAGAWKHRVDSFWRYDAAQAAATEPIVQTPAPGELVVSACPHPLRTLRVDAVVPAGGTLADVSAWVRAQAGVAHLPPGAVLLLDGQPIPAELWATTRTVAGQRIEYRALPRGGGAGRLLLGIAIMAVAWYAAPALLGFGAGSAGWAAAGAAGSGFSVSLASAGLNLIGGLLLNAIFPTRQPKQNNPGQAERQLTLQGGQNPANRYGAIPTALGRFRFTPPMGAIAYSETNATTAYLRMLLVWGYGPLQISDLRIGTTPLADFEEVEIETVTGDPDAPGDVARFNSLYANDVSQDYVNIELICKEAALASLVRTSNVVTATTGAAHGYSTGWRVTINGTSDGSFTGIFTVASTPTATTFTYAQTAANASASGGTALAAPWTSRVVSDSCDRITVTLHFPEGLRQMPVEGSQAGAPGPTSFRGAVQVRQLDPLTLAPVSAWGNIDATTLATTFALGPAWYNIDNDAELEPVYRWTRLSVNSRNLLIRRDGCFSQSQTLEPSGTLLTRLQQDNYGVGAVFQRLPVLADGEEPLWDICVLGDAVVQTIDRRGTGAAGVTGAALTVTGLSAALAAATLTRAQTEQVLLGGAGEPYYIRKDAFSVNVTFAVPNGPQEVRVVRTNSDAVDFNFPSGNAGRRSHACQLVSVTGYESRRPVVAPRGTALAMSAIRIKATNQVNGNVEGITGTVQVICLDYDTATTSWVKRPTRNPASLMRHVLQHPANAQRQTDAQINLLELADWHTYCRTNGFMFDAVLTEQRSLLDVLGDIAAAGRASPTLRDGQWTVLIDRPRTAIAQHFTPHNSWGFEGARALPKMPHGFRVQFNNASRGYQPDELIVYNDGYSVANATLLEGLALPGVTGATQIHKHARFHLAQAKLRPEQYTLNADIEHLVCTRGDLVRVTHDVPLWGLGSGRIRNRVSGTVLELDETVPMDGGVTYTIRIRTAAGASLTRNVVPAVADGYYSTITLASSVTVDEGAPGNLWLFGALGQESVELIVLGIEPAQNNTARLTFTDYAPAVYTSDSEAIPAYASQITQPPALLVPGITQLPTVTTVVSDERVMTLESPGVYGYRIRVAYTNPATLPASVVAVQGQIMPLDADPASGQWETTRSQLLALGSCTFADVTEGTAYRLRVRYVDEAGRSGPWRAVANHTVVGKSNPPARVTGLVAAPEANLLRLTWQANAEQDVLGYEVRTADSGWGGGGELWRGDVATTTVPPGALGVATTWYVKALDAAGLYSTLARSISYTVQAPAPVSNLRAQVVDNNVLLTWAMPAPTSMPVAAVRVRQGATWAGATEVGDKSGSFTSVQEVSGGLLTYWAATVDSLGNVATPVSVTTLVGDPPDFVFFGVDNSSLGGTVSSGVVENA